jgi:hypothetical protein
MILFVFGAASRGSKSRPPYHSEGKFLLNAVGFYSPLADAPNGQSTGSRVAEKLPGTTSSSFMYTL